MHKKNYLDDDKKKGQSYYLIVLGNSEAAPKPLVLEAKDEDTRTQWLEALETEIVRLKMAVPVRSERPIHDFPVFNDRLSHSILIGDELRAIDDKTCDSLEQLTALTKGKLSVRLKIFRPYLPREYRGVSVAAIAAHLNKLDATYRNYAAPLPESDISSFEEKIELQQFRFLHAQVNEQLKAEAELIRAVRLKSIPSIRRALIRSGIGTFATEEPYEVQQNSSRSDMVLLHNPSPCHEPGLGIPIPPIALSARSIEFKLTLSEARCLCEEAAKIEQKLRNILSLNSRREMNTHKHAILRAMDKIEKLLSRANKLGCESLMVVKEAQKFYHRMKEQLSNEPANLDARIGGPVELSGEWKGESKHEVTGDVTGWDRVKIIFTGNENSSDDLTGSIEGAGYVQLVALSIHSRIVTE